VQPVVQLVKAELSAAMVLHRFPEGGGFAHSRETHLVLSVFAFHLFNSSHPRLVNLVN
jgi:hypothetical protein